MVSVVFRLLLAATAALLTVLLPASPQARPASQVGSVAWPAWSPDGHSIVWSQLVPHVGEEIWVARRDMSGAHRITRPIDSLGKIIWLPGHRLVYEADFRLFSLDLRTRRSVLVSGIAGYTFAVDRRGDRIATGDAPCPTCGGPVRVLTVEGNLVGTVGGGRAQNMTPSFSPSGRRVAFDRSLCDNTGQCERSAGIWIASVASGALKRVTRSGICADWSPDGRSIVYVDGSRASLRVVRADGGPSSTVLQSIGICNLEFTPGWSPNSRNVAAVDSTSGALRVVDVRTHRVKVTTARAIGAVINFAWSPDSSQLLVAGQHGQPPAPPFG
jgi:Tol biopolymer transport system component